MTAAPERLRTALADRYRIERELGEGGMATVYLAHDVRHDRKVALKVLRPELSAIVGTDRFLAEIKTTANLQHPHILSLFDSGEADGTVFYVMPFVEGESLRDRLKREHQLGIDDALRIAREVADALDYAHRHHVVHRDIKPENILLHDGRALVADFGIALAVSRSDGATRLTETGMSLGTPFYMAPEQAMGERDITPRADVYALGCVLYEMLTGEPPFTGPTAQAIIARVLTDEPRPLTLQRRTVPPHVEGAVLTALAKLPADRFATAAQFAQALTTPAFASAAAAARAAIGTRARPTALPPYRLTALAPWAVALVAILAAVWGWAARGPRPGATWQYVTFPDGPAIQQTFPSMTLSPDGASLVIKDNIQNGLLWVKRRGELSPVSIPGTERSSNPAFSPDGQWIAFVADGRLKKIRPTGGAAITIADSAAGPFGGAAWLDDGTVIYTAPNLSEFWRVSAAGGPSAVAMRDSTLAGFGVANPAPLPRARGVLFTVCNSGCVTMSVNVLDLRTGRQHVLLQDGVIASLLPTGHILYVRRDGAALVAPFDLDRLEISGAAVPVLERVLVIAGFGFLTWSPTGTLAYLRGTGVGTEVEAVRVARDGNAVPFDTTWHGPGNSLSLSPDGRRLAVGVGRASGALSIWIKQLDRGPFSRLTFGGQDRRPAWSPDGREVAFIRDSLNTSHVYVRRADGSTAERPLVRLDRQVQEVAWAPRGDWVVVRTDNGGPGAGDVVGVRTRGDTTPVPLVASEFTELHPAISPDGRWIAYTSNESGQNEVYVRPFPGTVAGVWQVSNGGGLAPRWSPDGRELYFLQAQDAAVRLVAAQVRATAGFEVTAARPLFDATGFDLDAFHAGYDVLPGGRGFVFFRPWRAGEATGAAPLVMVDNWFADVRERLAR
jgi:serine/threonine-protein kinase